MIGNMLVYGGIALIGIGVFLIIRGISEQHAFHKKQPLSQTQGTVNGVQTGDEGDSSRLDVNSGGVIMIGPLPIIFGSDSNTSKKAMVLAIILMLIYLLVVVLV
ncbi:MAG: TIGR00304 family membrane protein [Methanohalophilus sp.]